MHFELSNADGNIIHTDGSAAIGGEGKGVRPMELLLMGAASCSTIDIVIIMKKMKQPMEDIEVSVRSEKKQMDGYSEYSLIHLDYTFYGPVEEKKARKAVSLSLEKYCSVSKMLEKTAKITFDVKIVKEGK